MAVVFVSHRTVDTDAARRIAADLASRGHEVWLDVLEINIGDSIVERMNAGMRDAEFLILCYSTQGVDGPYISREWMATLARQLQGTGVKILPARLPNAAVPPPILMDIRYADLAADWDTGIEQICAAMSRK